MFEGKEVDKTFDNGAGKYGVDVDDKGKVVFDLSYEKDFDGYAKLKSVNTAETHIFTLAEMITKKTGTTWDDSALAALKSLLGITDDQPASVQA